MRTRTPPSISLCSVNPATICSADRQQRTFSRLRERRYRTIPQLQAERAASPELSTLKANPRTGLPDSNRNDVWWSADGKEWHEVAPTPWLPRHANSVFVFDGSLWMGAQTSLACLSVSFLPIPWVQSRATTATTRRWSRTPGGCSAAPPACDDERIAQTCI